MKGLRARGPRAAAVLAVLTALAACASPPPRAVGPVPPSTAHPGVRVIEDVDFGAPDGIRLDVCLPSDPVSAVDGGSKAAGPGGRAAILSVHGGGWQKGDKAYRPWREVCSWLASEGFVVFQPNYRLAPEHPFPAAAEDLRTATAWIREDAQVERFGHDPSRLGAFGDSAGGNLVSLLGTSGEGTTNRGMRIDAVVELSAPIDLTREGIALGDLDVDFQRVQLDYLGCDSYEACAIAREASPNLAVDASDPPFFIAHSTDELIPIEQAEDFVARLEAVGVPVTYVPVEGSDHALAILDDALRDRIAGWLRSELSD